MRAAIESSVSMRYKYRAEDSEKARKELTKRRQTKEATKKRKAEKQTKEAPNEIEFGSN